MDDYGKLVPAEQPGVSFGDRLFVRSELQSPWNYRFADGDAGDESRISERPDAGIVENSDGL